MSRSSAEPSPSPSLRLTLLGAFCLERDGQPLALYSRKVESLFAYLVLHPKAHSREKLAGMFWGDSPDEQARLSLRVGLSDLRKKLGDAVLLADRETVQINPQVAVTVDVAEVFGFRLPLAEAEVEQVKARIDGYGGDLLTDFYDEWIDPLRDQYRDRYLAALYALIDRARAQGEYAQVVELGRRLLATDRANETAHQHVMFALAAQGERTAALEQYAACERALRAELDVAPSKETRALYLSIKQKSDTESAAARLTNLPKPLTSFVGREAELREIKVLMTEARLITLTGVGGAGKTRLAIALGQALVSAYSAGVWWVDLSSLAEAARVPDAVAKPLGVQERPNQPITETLVEFLRAKSLLLVVDNCEHLIAACATLIETLLTECDDLCVLATSREALGIPGEQVYPVPSLEIPGVGTALVVAQAQAAASAAATELLRFAAVRLFVERARSQQPGFQLNSQNMAMVVRICQRLDGIPLALELAAARVSSLSVEEIAQRLDDRFRLLTTGSRTALPRQQTLRALIDWSYDLLPEAERLLFRRLAVFAGGWTLEAAEQVCGGEGRGEASFAPADVLEPLTHLIAKSLVVAETEDGARRYRLLETIRDYARAKLAAANEVEMTQGRHYEYFVALAERAEPEMNGKSQIEWGNRLELEHDNLRAALQWAQTLASANSVLRLSGALHLFWRNHSHSIEGQHWYESAIGRRGPQCDPLYLAKAYSGAGSMRWMLGDLNQAYALHEQALAYFEQANDPNGIAISLYNLAVQTRLKGDLAEAESMSVKAFQVAQKVDNKWAMTSALMTLGLIAVTRGNLDESIHYLEESLAVAREEDNQLNIAYVLHNMGCVASSQGNFLRAAELLGESLRLAEQVQFSHLVAANLAEQGLLFIRQSQFVPAIKWCRRGAQVAFQTAYKIGLAICIEWLAAALGYQYQVTQAVQLWGAAMALREEISVPIEREYLFDYEKAVTFVRAQIGEQKFAEWLAQGRKMTMEQTAAFVLENTPE